VTEAEDQIAKANLLFEFNWKSYQMIRDMNKGLDDKIHNTMVVSGAMIPFLLGLFYFLFDKLRMPSKPLLSWVILAALVGMVFFLLTTIVGLMSYAPRKFIMVGTSEFLSGHGEEEILSITKQLVSDLADATASNRSVVVDKARSFCLMLVFLVVGAAAFLFMFVFIGVSLFLPCG